MYTEHCSMWELRLTDVYAPLRHSSRLYASEASADPITGRLIFEIFDDILPKTGGVFLDIAENLHYDRSYIGSQLDMIKAEQYCEGCAIPVGRGNAFHDMTSEQNVDMLHSCGGILTLARASLAHPVDHLGFGITFQPCAQLDGSRVILGRVVEGHDLLKEIEDSGSPHQSSHALKLLGNILESVCLEKTKDSREGQISQTILVLLRIREIAWVRMPIAV